MSQSQPTPFNISIKVGTFSFDTKGVWRGPHIARRVRRNPHVARLLTEYARRKLVRTIKQYPTFASRRVPKEDKPYGKSHTRPGPFYSRSHGPTP